MKRAAMAANSPVGTGTMTDGCIYSRDERRGLAA